MCNVSLKFLSCVCVVLVETCQEPFTIHCLLYRFEAVEKREWMRVVIDGAEKELSLV